jgi:signal transduction histidine kinase
LTSARDTSVAAADWSTERHSPPAEGSAPAPRRRLSRKYALLFIGLVGTALLINSGFDFWFSYQEEKAALIQVQQEKANAAAQRIEEFINEIQSQISWTTNAEWEANPLDQRRQDYLRLLNRVPAIAEVTELDSEGREQLKVSRLSSDAVVDQTDFSQTGVFVDAKAHGVSFSPIYFRGNSEPYMTIALAREGKDAGVTLAEINLKLVWDLVKALKIGKNGYAYVVDVEGNLIAHPDTSLVMRDTNLWALPQVANAIAPKPGARPIEIAENLNGRSVLTAHAAIPRLGWLVFVEVPLKEAFAPLYGAAWRTALLFMAGLSVAALAALILARRMTGPIRAIAAGAEQIGMGELDRRIDVRSGDELEGLAQQFNRMAADLQKSYAELEQRVADRTTALSEALDQQTATAEVLGVINSSPGDLRPVFDIMLEKGMELCQADAGRLGTYEGESFEFLALRGLSPAYAEFASPNKVSPGRRQDFRRIARGPGHVQIVDPATSKYYDASDPLVRGVVELDHARTTLTVPLARDDEILGIYCLYRLEVREFSDREIALIKNFAAQAVIAIENARLITETREALEQQTATAEVLKVISRSTFDLDTVLKTVVATARRLCNAEYGVIFRNEDGEYRFAAGDGNLPEYEERERQAVIRPGRGSIIGRAALEGRAVQILDAITDPEYEARDDAQINAAHSMLGVPLLREGETIGALGLARNRIEAFTDREVELVTTFADQAAIAIENARLMTETRIARDDAETALQELQSAQASLVQAEKMASLGQLTAGIAHEIKNPLNFVNNFAGLSVELLDELKEVTAPVLAALDKDKRADADDTMELLTGNLEKIAEHGKRADNIVKSMLEHSRGGSGERREVDLNGVIEEALNLAYHGARAQDQSFNITLERDYAEGLKPIELAPQEMTRVFLNLFGNGFYAANKRAKTMADDSFRPVLRVRTREASDAVEVQVRDNGTGIPPDIRDKLFQPFFTTKPTGEGTGLGLSISYDIVTQQHGGTIEVASEEGIYTEFTVRLPRR